MVLVCSNQPPDSSCLNNNKCKVKVLDEIYTSSGNKPWKSTWSNCLAVGFCWEVHGQINTRLTFISNLFRVSSGSLNTVSHFLELSSGCAGFVLFWKAYAAVSYRESTATLCFPSLQGYSLELPVSPSHLICVHLPTSTRNTWCMTDWVICTLHGYYMFANKTHVICMYIGETCVQLLLISRWHRESQTLWRRNEMSWSPCWAAARQAGPESERCTGSEQRHKWGRRGKLQGKIK